MTAERIAELRNYLRLLEDWMNNIPNEGQHTKDTLRAILHSSLPELLDAAERATTLQKELDAVRTELRGQGATDNLPALARCLVARAAALEAACVRKDALIAALGHAALSNPYNHVMYLEDRVVEIEDSVREEVGKR